jgi:hypothetical protein
MKYFINTAFCLLFVSNLFSYTIRYGENKKIWKNVNWRNVSFVKGSDGTLDATLAENEHPKEASSLLVLHFNKKIETQGSRRIGNFVVDRSRIVIDKRRYKFGGGAALFFRPKDTFRLKFSDNNFFRRDIDTGAFTFEFWMHPFSRANNEVVFQKYGPVYKDNKIAYYSGVKVYFYNGKLVWEFVKVFKDTGFRNRYAKVVLTSPGKISLYKWHHHALTYNPVDGKMVYYIDGREAKTVFCTDNEDADSTVLSSSFDRMEFGLLEIGKGYKGLIDEFVVSGIAKNAFRLNRYVNSMGLIVSGIIDIEVKGSVLKSINVNYKASGGAGVVLEYRISNRYYNPDLSETVFPWKEYNLEDTSSNGSIRGRYFQWRIKLLGSEGGKYSPVIKDIKMVFLKDRIPFKPMGLVAVSYNKKVYLRWQGNTEADVAGYKIYYGSAPGVYSGTLSMQGFSPVAYPLSAVGNKIMPSFVLSGLRVNKLYYISITAYDASGQESPFSKEIYIRVKRFKKRVHEGTFEREN